MAGTYKGKSLAPGGGGRFARLKDALMRKGYSSDRAEAIAAAHGRRVYGKKRFQRMALEGRTKKRMKKAFK